MRLVLWDIDHTLISTGGVGRAIFGDCFAAVTGRPMRRRSGVDGLTEPVIFRETCRLNGVAGDRALFEAFARCSARRHRLRAADLREHGHVLPGAAAALAALAARRDVVQGVVTGNTRAVARLKLEAFGLAGPIRFACGGYGDDHEERSALVDLAVRRSSAVLATPLWPSDDVVLVGDTVADVAAGRANKVRVLAVATGRTDESRLRAAGATRTVASLLDLVPLLRMVGADGGENVYGGARGPC
ncbi:HAD family hydrolase [Streptomyces minutiscleroticus]|uniref:Haloacid dehalogenase n=1 Tax=Streptomyces minutiscleroticus TaxID=68238 RepID=A0A918NRE7_9ACTN|nr:haloacid dehalogenase-like hydrolase [Streptomyces minutiscleroticus]GGX89996.1 haloacid dehalogenase [Streptomyces minutiscleroticus]